MSGTTLKRRDSLNGSAPDQAETVLLLLDVINDLEFPEGERLWSQARPMANSLRELKDFCRGRGIPAIYLNDNFGRWRSDFSGIVNEVAERPVRGREMARLLRPAEDDYFVLKPKHSGFFCTTLEPLLRALGARRLIITGVAAEICVLFTAHDGHMRDFELSIPSDCVASNSADQTRWALDHARRVLHAQVAPWRDLDLRPETSRSFKRKSPPAGPDDYPGDGRRLG